MAKKSSRPRRPSGDLAALRQRIRELESYEVSRSREFEAMDLRRRAYHMIAETTVHARDVTDLCSKVLAGLVNYLGFDLGTFRLFNTDTRSLVPVAVIGLTDKEIREKITAQKIEDPQYIAALVARTRQPIVAPDARNHPLYQTHADRVDKMNIHSMISWPVLGADDQVLGVLQMVSRAQRDMPDDERSFFETAIRMFSAVLQHKQIEKSLMDSEHRLKESAEMIKNLHKVALDLASCKRVEEVYRVTVDAAEKILKHSKSDLCIVEGSNLVTKVTSSAFPSGGSQVMTVDEGIAGMTFRNHKTYVFGNIHKVPEAKPVLRDYLSVISSPIGDMGVFQVFSFEENAFSVEDARILELLLGHTVEAVKRIRLQNELIDQAIRDPLTGVYNRYFLNQTLTQEINRATRYRKPITFLMVDIDRFKEINDRYGHNRGDMVLQAVAFILRDCVRECDIVVRFGGDEFLIIMPETEDRGDIVKNRIHYRLMSDVDTRNVLDFPISVSAGASIWNPGDLTSVENALAEADRKMYEEKNRKIE